MEYVELPLIMVRENSVNTSCLKEMQASKTVCSFFRSLEVSEMIKDMADGVFEEIEAFVKENYDENTQDCKKLIELKRDIYNLRLNKIGKYEAIVDKFTELEKTKKLFDINKELENINRDTSEIFEQEYETSRETLWKLWKNEDSLTCGLYNFDSNLANKLKDFLKHPANEHSAKVKKMDNTLFKILTRAVLKPSPFSTFCGIKMELSDVEETDEKKKSSILQLNYVHILRIWEMLSKQEEVMRRLHYRVNYSMRKSENEFSVSKLIDLPEENGKVYESRTMLVRIPGNELLDKLYDLRGTKQSFSYDELIQTLGIQGQEGIVKMLIEKKLINCVEKPLEISLDIINDFMESLKKWEVSDIQCVKEAMEKLADIQRLLGVIEESSDWEERNRTYNLIRDELGEIYKSFGAEKWCDKNVVYEDFLKSDIEKADFTVSSNSKEAMEILCDINVLFDVNVRNQTFFAEKIKRKYGDEMIHTSDGTLISQLIESNKNYNYLWENNMQCQHHEDDPEIVRQLDALKIELLEYIKKQFKATTGDTVVLDVEYLKSLSERIPQQIKNRKKSYEYFVQRAGDKLVINNVYSGYMMYFSRFLQYYPQLWQNKSFVSYVDQIFNGDEKICDIRVASGFNGNMRPNISKYELLVPTQTQSPDDTRIDYRDCFYKVDESEGRIKLFHPEIGDFTVVSQGSLMPLYLPGITGLIHSMFVNSLAFKDLNKMDVRESDEYQYMPRVQIGDLVVARQSWRIPNAKLDELSNQGEDFCTTFCNLNQWIKTCNIPRRVFIKKDVQKDMADMFLGKTDGKNLDMTARKPQYIDFENPVAVKLFLKMCSEGYDMIFEEAYPDYTDEDCFVQEAVCEVSYA